MFIGMVVLIKLLANSSH